MRRSPPRSRPALAAALALALGAGSASATPALVMDVSSGDVLYQQDATQPWYPASTTKLMTVYVALSAVRDHQIALDTPLVVSARAHAMPPSKMGFPIGTQVTLANALKMLMVRSANDLAITVAEGIAGSVEAFAEDMNRSAAQLGMRESHFVNPNGLPASDHMSSARDMALLARALYTEFPDQAQLFDLGALSLGREIIVNHNNLLGRYPGADGMKTGFTCAAGFNVVASAFRDGRRLVTVVMGAPTVASRTAKVAALFDRGFAGVDRPIASIVSLPAAASSEPPDMHNQVCRNRAPLVAEFNNEVTQLDAPLLASPNNGIGLPALDPERALLFSGAPTMAQVTPMAPRINFLPPPTYDPVPVHIGAEPGYTGPVAQARAPHSPIGTETAPVTAAAYAASLPRLTGAGPLGIDATALPLRGRGARARRTRPTMRASAEAPNTKVIEDAESGAGGLEKVNTAKVVRPAKAPRLAQKPVAARKATAKAVKKPEGRKAEGKEAGKGGKKLKSASGA